ncbi:MAG: hypothetical protein HC945_04065 [Nitrosarchaeum sp.]|nr:hypothetical protein [Nitrosarchaeum sp.]
MSRSRTIIIGTLILLLILLARDHLARSVPADPYNPGYNYTRFLQNLGTDTETYLTGLAAQPGTDPAEQALITGRLRGTPESICTARTLFEDRAAANPLEKVLLLETQASLGCENPRMALLSAAKIWDEQGIHWRATLLRDILANKTKPAFSTHSVPDRIDSLRLQAHGKTIMRIGNDEITITAQDVVMSQTDRTLRDWLSYQVYDPFRHEGSLLRTFSERLEYSENDLRPDIGWHEGARNDEIRSIAESTFIAGTGTLAAQYNDTWYAADHEGIFRYAIPEDKIMYPTTRFLGPGIAMIIDTHGINMLEEPAHREGATVVYADCDHPGKIKAALDLESEDITVVCTVDRFLHLLLGHTTRIMGNPPITATDTGALIGRRPITIARGESIIVMNSSLFYYDTPTLYFQTLTQAFPLNTTYVTVMGSGGTAKLTTLARVQNARIIAARVYTREDYEPLARWLSEDPARKAILFHTYAYPYGKTLMDQYPYQTTYQDPTPEFR